MKKFVTWLRDHLIPKIIAGLLIAAAGTWIGYDKGHDVGYTKGTAEAIAKLENDYKKKEEHLKADYDKRKQDLESELRKKEQDFNMSLAIIEEQFNKKVDQEIQTRYGTVLAVRFEEGKKAGLGEGYEKGRKEGIATARKAGYQEGFEAGRKIAQRDDALQQFLLQFLDHIDALGKASSPPLDKDKLKDAAVTLRESARRGRESFAQIMKQLNGTIDELFRAIEQGNIDRAVSLARAISNNRKVIEAQIKDAMAKLPRK